MSNIHSKSKRKKRNHSHKSEVDSSGFSSVSRPAFKGFLITLLCIAVLSLLCSVFCLYSKDPSSITLPVGIAVLYVSSFVGGLCSARANSDDNGYALASGVFCGFFIFVVSGIFACVISSFNVEKSGISVSLSLLLRALCVFTAFFGAYIGTRKKKRRIRRIRRKK